MTEEQREMSEKCVRGLRYQGNNLLCSNWDTEHMEELHACADMLIEKEKITREEFEALFEE